MAKLQSEDKTDGLPSNVVEQIEIWQEERSRMQTDSSVLYDRFESLELFAATVSYAKDLRVHLWSTPLPDPAAGQEINANTVSLDDYTLLIAADGHMSVRQFVIETKEEAERDLYE